MRIDEDNFSRYRHCYPEDADRMSLARLAAERYGMIGEFNYLLEDSLTFGIRANWSYLLACCGPIPDHKYIFSNEDKTVCGL